MEVEKEVATNSSVSELQDKIGKVFSEIGKVVVGQEHMINRLLVGLFSNGHVLLEGVPGIAKTLTVSTLAKVLHLDFQRIQFTPDLLPADLVGTMIYNQKVGSFEVKKGPVFANIILADEVNRSPAKVQSALLESMQEKQVTIGETTYPLDRPFLVLATQNPVDQEGTYPLPEAQVDRFMLKVHVDYPSKEEEMEVMRRMSNLSFDASVDTILTKEDIFAVREAVNKVHLNESIEKYIIELVYATREPKSYGLDHEAQYIQFGASPRATINMNLAAKVVAFFNKRDYVLPEDVKEVAPDVLNHRIILNYEAEADGVTTHDIIDALLKKVPVNY
ncbi:MAG: MoxR family ATPase [Cyclobacteriaceae bacterium]|nr:MoxR family ATPase [Cyclobacteriaceae bacterium]